MRLVNLLGHHGHLTFFPAWTEDFRCCIKTVSELEHLVQVMIRYSHHVKVVEILKFPLAAVAVIGRMLFVLVLLHLVLAAEDAIAGVTGCPMLPLLVLQTEFPIMSGPAGETPAAFDLIRVVGAVIEMVADSVVGEGAATALRHDEQSRPA